MKCTRTVVTGLVALCLVIAGGRLLLGVADLVAASDATTGFENDPLIPSEFRQVSLRASSSMLSEARIFIGFGVVLASAGVIFWTCRQRLISTVGGGSAREADPGRRFRRYAIYGMATSCLGVLISPFVGVVTLASHVVTLTVSEFLLLAGLGLCILAIAIGRDARIAIAKEFMPYGLAILGLLSSGYVLVWMFLRLLRELSWHLQAWL